MSLRVFILCLLFLDDARSCDKVHHEVSTSAGVTNTTTPSLSTITTKNCRLPGYVRWQGVCYAIFGRGPKANQINGDILDVDSCPNKANVAFVDLDEENARVQSYIDSVGPGQYYVNLFFSTSIRPNEWINYNAAIDISQGPRKVFWATNEPGTKTRAVMKYNGKGFWFGAPPGLLTATEQAYVVCQIYD